MIPLRSHGGRADANGRSGFSLIEVVLAIGVVSFALMALVALLPMGLRLARNSTEEMRAIYLISAVSSDLASAPLSSAGSANFHIAPTPWATNADRAVVPNPTVNLNTDYLFYAGEGQTVSDVPSSDARYRITLRYTRVPGKTMDVPVTSPSSIEAMLMVSWPAAAGATNLEGRVETYLVFPKP